MRKLRTKSDVTRAQIIQGALQALEKTGVIGTTTRSIATEANVQLATLHYHFESKSTLLVAVLEALIDENDSLISSTRHTCGFTGIN
jgi:AcrR family transcriptional regulator